jgi:hypothetical protein
MNRNLDEAIRSFDLTPNHRTIYDDPNELITQGFPAAFLLPLITIFESGNKEVYYRRGEVVEEMIGISHPALISAIAEYLGVPEDVGSAFTGRGFAMNAQVDAIRKILNAGGKDS